MRFIRLLALTLLLATAAALAASPRPARGTHYMVACDHPLAAQAALEVLRAGGNVVDAAVCASLTYGVVSPYHSGIGGGGFMLIRMAGQKPVLVDYRETAPAAARSDMYRQHGQYQAELSKYGALAIAVPGLLRGQQMALQRFGTRTLSQLLQPGVRIAEQGFVVDGQLAEVLQSKRDLLKTFGGIAATYLPGGQPLRAGDVLRQPALAATYRQLAERGAEDFYTGDLARRIVAGVRQQGGILTARDMASYRPLWREPVEGSYRGCHLYSVPPPSSGGVHVIQALQILEHFDLARAGLGSSGEIHLLAEAMRPAFADRSRWLGDPGFVSVPVKWLTSRQYAAELASRIRPDHRRDSVAPGDGQHAGGTAAFVVADAAGNVVVSTDTINLWFGSLVIPGDTGIVMNDEMDDFATAPGQPNAFGLVGYGANAVAPGKRPLSSMAPTLVMDAQGRPLLGVGAAGGSHIITAVLQAIVNVVDFGLDAQAAVSVPRVHHQWRPDVLFVEREVPADVVAGLQQRGHMVERFGHGSSAQAIRMDGTTLEGGSDPRGVMGTAGY